MSKLRVNDMASEFGITSDEVINLLRSMDVPVRSHLSALSDDQVARVRARWEREKRARAEKQTATAAPTRRRRSAAPVKEAAAPPPEPAPEEAPAAGVRRRRKAEAPPEPEIVEAAPAVERAVETEVVRPPAVEAPAPVRHEPRPEPRVEPRVEAPIDRNADFAPVQTQPSSPQVWLAKTAPFSRE